MPLVINSLGGGHTDTHRYTRRGQDHFLETSSAFACGRCTPGLKLQSSGQNDR